MTATNSPWIWVGLCWCLPVLMSFAAGWMSRIVYLRRKRIAAILKERDDD